MKKILALMLVAVMVCFVFVACDEDDSDTNGTETQQTDKEPATDGDTVNSVGNGGSFGVDFGELFGSEIILPDEEL